MKTKKRLFTLALVAAMLVVCMSGSVFAAESLDNGPVMDAELIAPSAAGVTVWNQYVPKFIEGGTSNEMILFTAETSRVTFIISNDYSKLGSINIRLDGMFYQKWGPTSNGSITFTGLTPGYQYNAYFSCYTASGVVELTRVFS